VKTVPAPAVDTAAVRLEGKMKHPLLLILVLLFLPVELCLADWIELKDGSHVEGRIISEAGESVKIIAPGGVKEIPKDQIRWKRKDAPGQAK
jgi:hypothetical protein